MTFSSLPAGTMVIVANTHSGHASLEVMQDTLKAILGQAGRPYHLVLVEDPQELEASLRRALHSARDCGGSLVIAGGDGTVNTLVNLLPESPCPLGILPMGTFNYFAREHGIPTDLTAAIQALLHAKAQPVALGMVNQRRFLVNASLGLYPQLLEEREAFKQKFGRWRLVALASALLTFLHPHRSQRLILESGGKRHQLRLLTLFVTHSRLQAERLGLALPDPRQGPQLTALLVRPGGLWIRLGLLLRSAIQHLGEAEHIRSFSFTHLRVSLSGRGRTQRIKVAMDGEVTWLQAPLEFSVVPDALCLLKPQPTRQDAP